MNLTEDGLQLVPLSGLSGKAYKGSYPDGTEVFIKMNTTPILAGLAKEQIAPQLLWSRRTSDGQIMSAQEWLNGRILTRADMNSKQIINILVRLHRSKPLVNQLVQLGYKFEMPSDLLRNWLHEAPQQVRENSYLKEVYQDLMAHQPTFREDHATIVHGDVHPSNWVATKSGMIYLVDWDTVHLCDRMFDVAHMLSHYIPRSRWQSWLTYYGYKYNALVLSKLEWYGELSYLYQISKAYETYQLENVNKEIYALRQFRQMKGRYSK